MPEAPHVLNLSASQIAVPRIEVNGGKAFFIFSLLLLSLTFFYIYLFLTNESSVVRKCYTIVGVQHQLQTPK